MLNREDAEKAEWRTKATDLREKGLLDTYISTNRSVPEIITAFILHRLGYIYSPHDLLPSVRTSGKVTPAMQEKGIPLFDTAVQNPAFLRYLVDTHEGGLSPVQYQGLNRLAIHMDSYRQVPPDRWWDASPSIENVRRSANRSLHNFLSSVVQSNFLDPLLAFSSGFSALERLFSPDRKKIDFAELKPITGTVPVIKGVTVDDEDIVDIMPYEFDRTRAVFLADKHSSIVIGGSPNSGKSTFSVSLYQAMAELIGECERDGIFGADQIKIGLCDLDLASPTSGTMLNEGVYRRTDKRPWTVPLAHTAVNMLDRMESVNNIVIGDLPGQVDSVVDQLTRKARFSAIVNSATKEGAWDYWKDFLDVLDRHDTCIGVRTHLDPTGENKFSGLIAYSSSYTRPDDRSNFLHGQVVNLTREPRPNDPFIRFAAMALLFDYLPGEVIDALNSQAAIQLTLSPGIFYSSGVFRQELDKIEERVTKRLEREYRREDIE